MSTSARLITYNLRVIYLVILLTYKIRTYLRYKILISKRKDEEILYNIFIFNISDDIANLQKFKTTKSVLITNSTHFTAIIK